MKTCLVYGCNRKHYGKGYCQKHYQRLYRKGSPTARVTTDPNEFVDCGEYWEIYLYDKDCNHIASAKIDPEDVEKCKQYKWHLNNYGYVIASGSEIYLHKFVMGADSSVQVDHIHRDKLDDRKDQLRKCNSAQNSQNQKIRTDNTSGVKNVNWHKVAQKWHVAINAYGIRYNKLFDNFEEAVNHADQVSVKLHGGFSRRR